MNGTTYGQKGGDGPTSGLKATTYEVTLPDGRLVRKRSFQVSSPEALAMCYRDGNGAWAVSGIVEEARDWPGQVPRPARMVT